MKDEKFTVSVTHSSRALTGADMLMIKRFGDGNKLDPENGTLSVMWYASCEVHNEYSSSNQDYTTLVMMTEEHGIVYTSSESFEKTLVNIFDDVQDVANDEGKAIASIRVKTNYKQSKKDAKKKFMVAALEGYTLE